MTPNLRYMIFLIIISIIALQAGHASGQVFCQEGDVRPCGKGACQGTTVCIGGLWSEECKGMPPPSMEICDNNIDDDCNGYVDDCGDATMTIMSYIMIGAGAGLLVFAIVISKIQSRKMEEDKGEEEKTLDDPKGQG